ncbi:TPA: DUF2635 domain-containing protein [Pasteurella multocida]|nr:DUF2635 domain-containing protein [Pasteurella multocida]HDR1812205.1 DUF2635 domain-containing protein [Pasteurella multocida]
MEMFKIKPKKGLIIRDPETFEQLAEEGEEKPRTSYWLNHLKNGDVEIVETKSRKGEK